jgi:hypothetical protein
MTAAHRPTGASARASSAPSAPRFADGRVSGADRCADGRGQLRTPTYLLVGRGDPLLRKRSLRHDGLLIGTHYGCHLRPFLIRASTRPKPAYHGALAGMATASFWPRPQGRLGERIRECLPAKGLVFCGHSESGRKRPGSLSRNG